MLSPWHVTFNIWAEVAKGLQILLIPFLMLSAAMLTNSKLTWLKTWEPGALCALIKSSREREAFFEGLEVALRAGCWQQGWGSVVGFAAGQDVVLCWFYFCSSSQHALTLGVSHWLTGVLLWPGIFAQCCSGSLTDVAELLKRTKEVLVKIKCFLLVSSPWKCYVCMVRVCI